MVWSGSCRDGQMAEKLSMEWRSLEVYGRSRTDLGLRIDEIVQKTMRESQIWQERPGDPTMNADAVERLAHLQ